MSALLRLSLFPAWALVFALVPQLAHGGDAELKAAQELVRIVTPKPVYEAMMHQLTQNMLASMGQTQGAAPPELVAKFDKVMADVLPYDEMMTWSAEVYAKRFTAAEIKDLIKFYKTPLGAKLAKSLPEIMGEVGRKTGEILPARLPGALQKVGLGGPPAAPPPGGVQQPR